MSTHGLQQVRTQVCAFLWSVRAVPAHAPLVACLQCAPDSKGRTNMSAGNRDISRCEVVPKHHRLPCVIWGLDPPLQCSASQSTASCLARSVSHYRCHSWGPQCRGVWYYTSEFDTTTHGERQVELRCALQAHAESQSCRSLTHIERFARHRHESPRS